MKPKSLSDDDAIECSNYYWDNYEDANNKDYKLFYQGACWAHSELLKRAEVLVSALEVYAMTNEIFPEYGDVARKVLREWKEGVG